MKGEGGGERREGGRGEGEGGRGGVGEEEGERRVGRIEGEVGEHGSLAVL